ncbi:MAG: hypothetical protein IKY98_00685 [Alphaproteobacteria bacterium]|nr:hypothetical protein [Alphaproteobacteria bacterium]
MNLYTKFESGRSMVEMLGVLAVVGVLSIGGIAGYSYGMDKYRANETTNQIMLRAIDLMTQAAQGNETLSLAGWNNEQTQYDFGTPEYTNDGFIVFDVGTNEKMPKRICEIVYDAMKDTAVQIDINATRADSNATCGDDNEMTFYFEGGISLTCDPACPEGQYCDNGICFKGEMPEKTGVVLDKDCISDADCNTDWTGTCAYCDRGKCTGVHWYNDDDCTINEGNVAGQCNFGICYPKGCTTNEDCKEVGTYCASTNNSDEVRFQDGEMGACAKLNFIRKEIGGKIYYLSNEQMSWWDAEYACKAISSNIDMVKITDLVEESSWNGESDNDVILTPLGGELQALFGFRSVWTQNLTSDKKYALVGCFMLESAKGSVVYGSYNKDTGYGGTVVVCH